LINDKQKKSRQPGSSISKLGTMQMIPRFAEACQAESH